MTNKPKKNEQQAAIIPKFKKDEEGRWFMPQNEGGESPKQKLMKILGSKDSDAFGYLLEQLLTVVTSKAGGEEYERMNQVTPLIQAIAPRDEFEGMLAVQMISIHAMAMEMMKRVMIAGQTSDGVNFNINRATKLTRTFIAQMEALDKHRGKGEQKITVEHVTVNEGGQAIVGNVK